MSTARERALAKLHEPIPGREPRQHTVRRPLEPVVSPAEPEPAAEPAKLEDRVSALEPGTVEQTVLDAVEAAAWLEASDLAAVAVARRIARDLDRLPAGDGQVATLSRSLTSVLTSLQLTPAGRRQHTAEATSGEPELNPLERLRRSSAAARLADQVEASA